MILALAVLLGAAPACSNVEESVSRMQAAASVGDLVTEIADARRELGAPLLSSEETDRPLKEQKELAVARLRTACELYAEPAVQGIAGDGKRLEEILNRPEFSRARDRNPEALLQLINRIRDWLKDLLGDRPAQAFASGVRMLVLVLAFAVVALAIWRLSTIRRSRKTKREEVRGAEPLELLDPGVHLNRARSLADVEPRNALREALLALLSELERRRLARPDRVKTNRELADELPQRGAPSDLSARVKELLRGYDRTYYSLDPVEASAARTFADQVEALRESLGASA